MGGTPQYCDISGHQGTIDFHAYKAWTASFDGISRIAMKSTEGVGFTDPRFAEYRAGALAAGIDVIIYYHFARPGLGNTPDAEAEWQHQVVGAVRPQDIIMLDLEENSPQATAQWAYEWLFRQEANYGGKLPTIYASDAYIRQRLQDSRLARYPLTLANWQFTPLERPPCPPPWNHYTYLQYTDRAFIPGIPGLVDANIYLGGNMTTVPTGWHDDGTTLTSPNGIHVVQGFRDHVMTTQWDPDNWPLQPEEGIAQLEISNPALGNGTWQPFRWKVLEWSEKLGVLEMWTGQELLAARKQAASLQQQLDANVQAQHIKALQDTLAQIGKLASQSQ